MRPSRVVAGMTKTGRATRERGETPRVATTSHGCTTLPVPPPSVTWHHKCCTVTADTPAVPTQGAQSFLPVEYESFTQYSANIAATIILFLQDMNQNFSQTCRLDAASLLYGGDVVLLQIQESKNQIFILYTKGKLGRLASTTGVQGRVRAIMEHNILRHIKVKFVFTLLG